MRVQEPPLDRCAIFRGLLPGLRVRLPMVSNLFRALALFAVLGLLAAAPARAAEPAPFTQAQLDQMLAPIALFPDALLSQVLMATTYPVDVEEAVEWALAHRKLEGDAAVKAVQDKPWDPSVQSLVAFPQVLAMLGEKPQWVRDLGDAFLAQPGEVMDSVQFLRQKAKAAGNLASNDQQIIAVEPAPPPPQVIVVNAPPPPTQIITIVPANPQVVFVPMYNPVWAFGPWWHPAFPPFFFPPGPRWGWGWHSAAHAGFWWGVGIGVSNSLWGGVDWRRRDVNINVNHWNNINVNRRIDSRDRDVSWRHDVRNRHGVPYRDAATRDRLQQRVGDARARDDFRGRDAAARPGARGTRQSRRCAEPRPRRAARHRPQPVAAAARRGRRQRAIAPRASIAASCRTARPTSIVRSCRTARPTSIARSCRIVRPTSTGRRCRTAPVPSIGRNCEARAGNMDRAQLEARAAGMDRAQMQNRAAGVDRSQIQNRNASRRVDQPRQRAAQRRQCGADAPADRSRQRQPAGDAAAHVRGNGRRTPGGGRRPARRVECGSGCSGEAALVMGPLVRNVSVAQQRSRSPRVACAAFRRGADCGGTGVRATSLSHAGSRRGGAGRRARPPRRRRGPRGARTGLSPADAARHAVGSGPHEFPGRVGARSSRRAQRRERAAGAERRLDAADSRSCAAARAGPSTCGRARRKCAFVASAATSSRRSRSMYAYFDAQREYATQDRDGDGVLEYARRFLSTPRPARRPVLADGGRRAAEPGGTAVRYARHQGRLPRLPVQDPRGAGSGGERRRAQLPHCAGQLANGFALVAWPARYGDTGVMSFLVNHDGVVYQKDLGPASAAIASAMTRFDPDATWVALPAP